MNVFHLVASSSMTGPAEPAAEVCRWLVEHGHQARLFGDSRTEGDLFERLDEMHVPWSRELRLSQKSGLLETLGDARRLRRRVREESVDVVHAHHSQDHHVALLGAAGLRARTRVVRTVHARRGIEFRLSRGPVYRATDGIVTVCEAYRRELLASYRLDPDRMAVIAGGVDTQRFTPGRNAELRGRLGVPEDAPLVGIVSRIKAERNHEVLVRGFAQAAVAGAHLCIVGRGEHEPAVRALVQELGLERVVHFAGYATRHELAGAYRALDVFAWLVEGNDGSCRAVLEAMATGLPVVGGRGGAIPEIVVEGETGLLTAADSEAELGTALATLLGDAELRRRMGAAGRRRAEERYAQERRGRATFEFYQKVHTLAPA